MTAVLFIPSIHYNAVPIYGKDELVERSQRNHWKEETYLKDVLCVAYYTSNNKFDGWDTYSSRNPAYAVQDIFHITDTSPELLI